MRAPARNLCGETTTAELVGVLAHLSLLVTSDSGPMHVAAALGVPVVAVFGPTDWRETAPRGDRHRLVREPVHCSPCKLRECPIDHRCMTRITADRVLDEARALLGRRPRMKPAIFMDRDGTLCHEVGYVNHLGRFRLYPYAVDAVRLVNRSGFLAVVVTNQAGVARGYFPESLVHEVHAAMRAAMEAGGARLDGVYVCVHHPSAGEPPYRKDCDCRKPRPGLLRQAEADLGIDLRPVVDGGRPPRRPGGGLERGGPRGAGAQRLRPGRADVLRERVAAAAGPGRRPPPRGRAEDRGRGRRRRRARVTRAADRPSAARLIRIVDAFRGRRLLVLADLVADEFLYGRVQRVSREAPVLILQYDATDVRLGGGANAVHNIRTLGGRPLPLGVLGGDDHGRRLRAPAPGQGHPRLAPSSPLPATPRP